jgi:hypothetical protein
MMVGVGGGRKALTSTGRSHTVFSTGKESSTFDLILLSPVENGSCNFEGSSAGLIAPQFKPHTWAREMRQEEQSRLFAIHTLSYEQILEEET